MSKVFQESSGNVFFDLGFSNEKSEILALRTDLMSEIRKWIKDRKLTQVEAAKILNISQSRVSDLVTGKWEKLGLEMLIILGMRSGINLILTRAADLRKNLKPPSEVSFKRTR
ncbi:MAG: helix-turn-helix domain-containing protein [Candidatus Rifleibacteriota bacterium]